MKDHEGRLFPLFISLEGHKILVVGGGAIAERRVESLLPFGANLTVVAPSYTDKIAQWGSHGKINLLPRVFAFEDLRECDLVLAATSDAELNAQIYYQCRELQIPANDSSDVTLTDFHFPGIVCQGDLTIGINASGKDHSKARRARLAIEECLRKGDI